jgi:DNA (cytosine-5)-methyltransferase 1
MKIKGLSLFASGGVGEAYLKDTNIEIVVANELLNDRAKFFQSLYTDCHMIAGNIRDKKLFDKIIDLSIKNSVEYIQATPPCQGFSVAGKMDPDDERNDLYKYIIYAANKINPKYILIENVSGFMKLLNIMKEQLPNYHIECSIIDSKDYETPQSRKRCIMLISRNDVSVWKFPSIVYKEITVRQAIGHLPSLEAGEKSDIHKYHYAKNHNTNHILWMKHTPSGKSALMNDIYYPQKDNRKIKGYNTTYKRMEWDKPAPTITMMNGSISSQNNVHPGRLLSDGTYSDARALTIYELIKLTGLPDDWQIPEWASDTLIRHILGEAVMPKVIYHLVKNL